MHKSTFPPKTGGILLLTLLFALPFFSCKDKCDAGFDRDGDTCACPTGRYIIGDSCLAPDASQYYWPVHCSCLEDTFFVKIKQVEFAGVLIDEFQLHKGTTTRSVYSSVSLIQSDSIATGASLINYGSCTVNGKICNLKFEGRRVHPDTIRGNVVFRWADDQSVIVETCPTIMYR